MKSLYTTYSDNKLCTNAMQEAKWTTVERKVKRKPAAKAAVSKAPEEKTPAQTGQGDLVLRKYRPATTLVSRDVTTGREIGAYQAKLERYADGENVEVKTRFPATFINKMKTHRQTLKLSQEDYAKQLSVTRAIVRDIENGSQRYDPGLMQRLSNAIDRMMKKSE